MPRPYRRRFDRPTSRQITDAIIAQVAKEHPDADDLLAYIVLRTDARESQAIIAIRRAARRSVLSYCPYNNRYTVEPTWKWGKRPLTRAKK